MAASPRPRAPGIPRGVVPPGFPEALRLRRGSAPSGFPEALRLRRGFAFMYSAIPARLPSCTQRNSHGCLHVHSETRQAAFTYSAKFASQPLGASETHEAASMYSAKPARLPSRTQRNQRNPPSRLHVLGETRQSAFRCQRNPPGTLHVLSETRQALNVLSEARLGDGVGGGLRVGAGVGKGAGEGAGVDADVGNGCTRALSNFHTCSSLGSCIAASSGRAARLATCGSCLAVLGSFIAGTLGRPGDSSSRPAAGSTCGSGGAGAALAGEVATGAATAGADAAGTCRGATGGGPATRPA